MNTTKKNCLTALLSIFLVACNDSDNDNTSSAYVRILHASPDAPNVDVLVDGSQVLVDVSYQQGSGYLKVDAGARDISLRVSGTETIALENTLTLASNGYYSVIAQDNVASLELEVLDDTSRTGNDSTDLTVVHASTVAGNVDIYVTADGVELPATATLENVPFDANASLANVANGDYQVRLTAAGSTDVVYNSSTLAVASDVTAVAVNSIQGVSPASLLIWTNTVTPVLDATAEVRIVHAADPVDIFVAAAGADISMATPNFADVVIGQNTGYTALDGALAYDVVIAADGTTAAAVPGTANLTFGTDTVTTAIAIGNSVPNLEAIILNDKR